MTNNSTDTTEQEQASSVLSPASAKVHERFPNWLAFVINFFRRLGTLLFTAIKEFFKDECQNLAAQISYYAIFSVFPLILVTVIIISFFLPQDLTSQEKLIGQLTGNFPNNTINVSEIIRTAIKQVSSSQPLFIAFSIVSLIWAGTGIFDSITNSLNKAWQIPGVKPRNFFESLLIRFVLFLIFGAMLLGSVAVTFIYEGIRAYATTDFQLKVFLKDNPIWDILSFLIPWTLTFATFILIYRVVPQRKVTWSDVWPGAVVAAIFFELIKIGFTFYISRFTNYNLAYGPIAGVVIFLFWLYLIAIVLLLGGEVSSVWAEMRGHKRPNKLGRQGKADEAPATIDPQVPHDNPAA